MRFRKYSVSINEIIIGILREINRVNINVMEYMEFS